MKKKRKESMSDYGVMRLASRISSLKKKGYKIVSKIETSVNRFGENKRYARYSLCTE